MLIYDRRAHQITRCLWEATLPQIRLWRTSQTPRTVRDFIAKAERFLNSARVLLEHEDTDSAASRCYYAMFFMVEAVLLTKGITASSHRGVFSLFGKHFVKPGIFSREMASALREAYDKRLVGDYEVRPSLSREEAEALLRAAEDFVAALKCYLQGLEVGRQ